MTRGVWTDSPLPEISSDWMLGNVRFTASNQIWAFGTDLANKRGVILRYSANAKETISTPSEAKRTDQHRPECSFHLLHGGVDIKS